MACSPALRAPWNADALVAGRGLFGLPLTDRSSAGGAAAPPRPVRPRGSRSARARAPSPGSSGPSRVQGRPRPPRRPRRRSRSRAGRGRNASGRPIHWSRGTSPAAPTPRRLPEPPGAAEGVGNHQRRPHAERVGEAGAQARRGTAGSSGSSTSSPPRPRRSMVDAGVRAHEAVVGHADQRPLDRSQELGRLVEDGLHERASLWCSSASARARSPGSISSLADTALAFETTLCAITSTSPSRRSSGAARRSVPRGRRRAGSAARARVSLR